jgi:MYXO-CTERM domain-containing protein
VVWDGKNFVATWYEGERGLVVARIAADGTVLDRPGVVIAGTEGHHFLSHPSLCADGDSTLIVWGRRAQPPPPAPLLPTREAELHALRLPAGASPAGLTSVRLTTTADDTAPVIRLGCNRDATVVAWNGRLGPDHPPSLYLGRILRGTDSFDRRPGIVQMQKGVVGEEAGIATDGSQFLVTWRSIFMGARTVWGMRIDQDGFLLDSPAIQVGTSNSGRRPTAWWDGQQYVVTAVHTMDGLPFELRARRVSGAGRVLDAQWFPLARLAKQWGGAGAGCVSVPAGPGRALLVYEQYADDDGASNPRARARLVTTPLGSPPADAGAPPRDAGPTTDGGADAPADAAPPETPAPKSDGCGCRVGGAGSPGLAPVGMLLLVVVIVRRRRPASSSTSA